MYQYEVHSQSTMREVSNLDLNSGRDPLKGLTRASTQPDIAHLTFASYTRK
jgi:hypothetical protein